MNKNKKKIPVKDGNLSFVNIIFFYTRGSVTSLKKYCCENGLTYKIYTKLACSNRNNKTYTNLMKCM